MDFRVFPPTKIYVDKSPIHGYGVFAKEKISKGEIFEETLLLTLPINKESNSDLLKHYRFNWPQGNEWDEQVCALGFGSLYNHSESPNAFWKSNTHKKTFEFVSLRDILPGEEIFVWYGGENYWSDGRTKLY